MQGHSLALRRDIVDLEQDLVSDRWNTRLFRHLFDLGLRLHVLLHDFKDRRIAVHLHQFLVVFETPLDALVLRLAKDAGLEGVAQSGVAARVVLHNDALSVGTFFVPILQVAFLYRKICLAIDEADSGVLMLSFPLNGANFMKFILQKLLFLEVQLGVIVHWLDRLCQVMHLDRRISLNIEELSGAILHLMIGLDLLGINAISLLRSGWRVECFRMVRLHLRVLVHERGVADVARHRVIHQAG